MRLANRPRGQDDPATTVINQIQWRECFNFGPDVGRARVYLLQTNPWFGRMQRIYWT